MSRDQFIDQERDLGFAKNENMRTHPNPFTSPIGRIVIKLCHQVVSSQAKI